MQVTDPPSIHSWTLLDNSVILSSSPPTVSPSVDDLASSFIEKVDVTGRECLQASTTKSAHLPACKPSHSTFSPLRGTTRLSPVLHLYCIINLFSLLDHSHQYSNLLFFYPIVLKKKISLNTTFLFSDSPISYLNLLSKAFFTLANMFAIIPPESPLLVFLAPWLHRIYSYQGHWWHPCHYTHWSIHLMSLTYQQPWAHLITVPNFKSSFYLAPRTSTWLVVCLPSWLLPICFFVASFSSLWPLNIGGNQDSLNRLLFHPHPHFDEPIFLKALNTM